MDFMTVVELLERVDKVNERTNDQLVKTLSELDIKDDKFTLQRKISTGVWCTPIPNR